MALILQIETTTISCSVALSVNGNTIAVKELAEKNAHASYLTVLVQELMIEGNKQMAELDAVAVSMGPGSYTGLRIGVSTAKGFCYALDIPLIAVNTLEAMAYGYKSSNNQHEVFYCPMIDARRMEVYTAVYDNELTEIMPVSAKIIDEHSFSEFLLNNKLLFFGDGAMKCREVLNTGPNSIFVPGYLNSAKDMTELAFRKFNHKQFEDVAYFEPYYLKDFVTSLPKKK